MAQTTLPSRPAPPPAVPAAPVDLKALDRAGLEALAQALGEPPYRGRQLFKWLYQKGAATLDEMTDLPRRFREALAQAAALGRIENVRLQEATDRTLKGLFRLSTGRHVEAVLIPDFDEEGDPNRLTVCVSSQVGCAMACGFCATGQMGFQQNLTAGEIFDQVWFMNEQALARFGRRITNVVFMGMGEPLLNYDHVLRSIAFLTDPDGFGLAARRITVSTVGLARRIRQLADDGTRFNLAISLHAPSDAKRSSIMPVNRAAATDLKALREAVQHYTRQTGRRVTYEYCMFAGFNDTDDDARRLAGIVSWAPSKVNLIMYNPVEGLGFTRTPEARLDAFIRVLVDRGVTVTVRRSRGQDIDAACGQLAVKEG
jgi:23S rRNA (adenine2503-C2)-methyltransferase